VYDDGWYCYSCHSGSRKSEEHWAYRPKQLTTTKKNLIVPANTLDINKFSNKTLEWLYSYYVYDELIKKYGIAYAPATDYHPESLVLPVQHNNIESPQHNNLLFSQEILEYQRRFFPKAFFSTSGVKDVIFIMGEGERLVIVEDYISAIRVAEHTSCLCMFGTSLNSHVIQYIINNYTDVAIWLDNDEPGIKACDKIYEQLKKEYRLNIKLKPMLYQNDINLHKLKRDKSPKDYCDYEIKNIINNHVSMSTGF
jgi:hypothetical protein